MSFDKATLVPYSAHRILLQLSIQHSFSQTGTIAVSWRGIALVTRGRAPAPRVTLRWHEAMHMTPVIVGYSASGEFPKVLD